MNATATGAAFCPAGTWGAGCSPCSPCPNGSIVLHVCSLLNDTICRRCHEGFSPQDGLCIVSLGQYGPTYEVLIFLVVVCEILLAATTWHWWRRHRLYTPVQPYDI